jgi:hypothetical protein
VHIPDRTATDDYLARMGEQLDVVFDVDLGELIEGHHVVARGLAFGRSVPAPRFELDGLRRLIGSSTDPDSGGGFFRRALGPSPATEDAEDFVRTDAELHYEFVPGHGSQAFRGFAWYWKVYASDDVGTNYANHNSGAFDGESAGAAAHGSRDLGGQIPPEATRLTLRFEPPTGWAPPEPWRRELVIDLVGRRLAD